ncbi:MAG: hypothetical protein CMH57_14445 [Myxococcales bacterium]|nr:hypothetical protein [Myxococcales bacterium]
MHRTTRGALALLGVVLGLMLTVEAAAAPTLRILHTKVSEADYEIYFSLQDANNQPIQDLDGKTVELIDTKNDEQVSVDEPSVKLLHESDRPAMVLFIVANYRAFNDGNANAFTAVSGCLDREDASKRTGDTFAVMHYGENSNLVPASSVNSLKAQLEDIPEGNETIPKLFSALDTAIVQFDRKDPQANARRYMVIISDGHGEWEGAEQRNQRAQKKIDRLVPKLKEKGITPIIIGFSPTGNLGRNALAQLSNLAEQGGGTYRPAVDAIEVSSAVDDACNAIYNSYVYQFKTGDFEPKTAYNVKLKANYQGEAVESAPAKLVTPEILPESSGGWLWWLMVIFGGGIALMILIGILVVIGRMFTGGGQQQQQPEPMPVPAQLYPAPGPAPGPVAPVPPPRPVFDDRPPPRFYGKFTGLNGDYTDRKLYIVDETTTIGSADGNSINIQHGTISKKHAGIRIKDGNRFEMHDFGSTNGVFINGKRITKQFLKDGDRVQFGKLEFIFTLQ